MKAINNTFLIMKEGKESFLNYRWRDEEGCYYDKDG
jgi:hypothetical protein